MQCPTIGCGRGGMRHSGLHAATTTAPRPRRPRCGPPPATRQRSGGGSVGGSGTRCQGVLSNLLPSGSRKRSESTRAGGGWGGLVGPVAATTARRQRPGGPKQPHTPQPRALRERGRRNAPGLEQTPRGVLLHALQPPANQRRTSDRGSPRCGLFDACCLGAVGPRRERPTQADGVWPAQAERGCVEGLMEALAARLGERKKTAKPPSRAHPTCTHDLTSRGTVGLQAARLPNGTEKKFPPCAPANQVDQLQHSTPCTAFIGRRSRPSEAFL